jgi:hypothetical protein
MIITKDPLTHHVAVDKRSGAVMADKYDAEALNLLKIDALGLIQLSIIEDCLDMTGHDASWLLSQSLENPDAFKILNDHKFCGIFQFQGFTLQSLVQQTEITCFNDLVALTSLARPGPLHAGGTEDWLKRKRGEVSPEKIHPILDKILADTLGVIIYQEQVMQIGREIGGLSWEDVSSLRKGMGKSLGSAWLNRFREKFLNGAVSHLETFQCEQLWESLLHHGSYSFNKSHAVSYALVSYWCCILKHLYPLEFAAATVRREKDDNAVVRLLRELTSEGIEYVAFDPENSGAQWNVSDGKLVGPISGIRGVGPVATKAILESRAQGGELPARYKKFLDNPATPWDELYPISKRFREFYEHPLENGIQTQLAYVEDITANIEDGTKVCVIGTVTDIALRDHNESTAVERRGYTMSNPTLWLNLMIQDDTDNMMARVSRFKYEQFGKHVVDRGKLNDAVYLVKGTVDHGFRKIEVERIKFLGLLSEQANG